MRTLWNHQDEVQVSRSLQAFLPPSPSFYRPLTPQSPKPVMSGLSQRSQPPQAVKANISSSVLATKPQPLAVPSQSDKAHLVTQQLLSATSSILQSSTVPTTSLFCSQDSSYKLNACVQTSVSHNGLAAKSVCNSVNLPKPTVPQSPKLLVGNQPGLCITQTTIPTQASVTTSNSSSLCPMKTAVASSIQSSYQHMPQPTKVHRPHTPQSPRSANVTQCTIPQTNSSTIASSQSSAPLPKYQGISQQPESRLTNTNKNKTEVMHESRNKKVDNLVQGSVPSPVVIPSVLPVSQPLPSVLPVSQPSSSASVGELKMPLTSTMGNYMHLLQGTHVSVPTNTARLYPDSIGNSLTVPLTNTFMSPEMLAAGLSFPYSNVSATVHTSTSSVSNSCSVSSAQTCPTTISQTCYQNPSLCTSLSSGIIPSVCYPVYAAQTSLPASLVTAQMGHTINTSTPLSMPTSNLIGIQPLSFKNAAIVTTHSGGIGWNSKTTTITPATSNASVGVSESNSNTAAGVILGTHITTVATTSLAAVSSVTATATSGSATVSSAVSEAPGSAHTAALSVNCTSKSAKVEVSTAITTVSPSKTTSSRPAVDVASAQNSAAETSILSCRDESVNLPPSSRAGTAVSVECTKGTTAPVISTTDTVAPISTTVGTNNPVRNNTDITTVSLSSKTSTTIGVSSKTITAAAAHEGASTSTPSTVSSTAGVPVPTTSCEVMSTLLSSPSKVSPSLSSRGNGGGSQSCGCFTPCSIAGGKWVCSVKEKGGSREPVSSACTPVCDVSHVIDAKPSVSSSGGPRPCLKS